MAKYLANADYAAGTIKKLEAAYPGIIHDPLVYDLIYSAVRAMPRVQGVVRRNYVTEVARLTGGNVCCKTVKDKDYKDEEYDTLKIERVEPTKPKTVNPFLT